MKQRKRLAGRPRLEVPAGFEEEIEKWQAGEQTATETMEILGLKRTSFYKLVKEVVV